MRGRHGHEYLVKTKIRYSWEYAVIKCYGVSVSITVGKGLNTYCIRRVISIRLTRIDNVEVTALVCIYPTDSNR